MSSSSANPRPMQGTFIGVSGTGHGTMIVSGGPHVRCVIGGVEYSPQEEGLYQIDRATRQVTRLDVFDRGRLTTPAQASVPSSTSTGDWTSEESSSEDELQRETTGTASPERSRGTAKRSTESDTTSRRKSLTGTEKPGLGQRDFWMSDRREGRLTDVDIVIDCTPEEDMERGRARTLSGEPEEGDIGEPHRSTQPRRSGIRKHFQSVCRNM